MALETPADFVDVDLTKYLGDFYASHNPYKEVPLFDRIIRKFLTVGPFQPSLEDVAQTLKENNKSVSLDLKNLNSGDLPKIQRILTENSIEESTVFNSKNPRLVQALGDTFGPDRTYLSVGTQSDLDRLNEGGIPDANFSMARHLATPEIVRFLKSRGYKVILFPLNSAVDALKYLGMGIDGFVSDNIGLLNVFGQRNLELI